MRHSDSTWNWTPEATAMVVLFGAVVVTLIEPVVAPGGTVATNCPVAVRVKVAVFPLKLTAVAEPRFVPEIVTGAPAMPAVGAKLQIAVGTLNMVGEVTALKMVKLTRTLPVVAFGGTVARI